MFTPGSFHNPLPLDIPSDRARIQSKSLSIDNAD